MKRWLTGLALATALAAPVLAQEKKDDRFEKAFFDPQLVLQRSRDIGLTQAQRQQILDAVKKAQTELVPLQLDMAEPALDLVELVEETRIDESAAIAKADRMLKIENEVKKAQMSLLIRIKNILTKEQQDRLRAIRDGGRRDEPGDGSESSDQES